MVPLSENHHHQRQSQSISVWITMVVIKKNLYTGSLDVRQRHKGILILKQQKTTKVKQTSSVLMVSSTVTTTVALSTGESSCLSS